MESSFLFDDLYQEISRHLVAPSHYYALACTNKVLWQRLVQNPKIHGPMRRAYFDDWRLLLSAIGPWGPIAVYLKALHKSTEFTIAAIRRNYSIFEHVRDQTEEICLVAVQERCFNLAYVRKKTPAICLAAVTSDGKALRYVPEDMRTPEICLAAVLQNPHAIVHVKDKTPAICDAASKK